MRKTVEALGSISSTETGGKLVSQLQSSDNSFFIKRGKSEFSENNTNKAVATNLDPDVYSILSKAGKDLSGGSGGDIFWNATGGLLPTLRGMDRSPVTDLAHEMFHAQDSDLGKLNNIKYNGVKAQEWSAVYRENILRQELGIPLRTHYRVENNKPSGPRLLSPAKTPYLPFFFNKVAVTKLKNQFSDKY